MNSAPVTARLTSRRRRVILTAALSLLFIAIVEPTYAQGSTTIAVDLGPVLRTAEAASQHQELIIGNGSTTTLELDPTALVNAGEIAMIAQISKQIEAARNPIGAKLYAKDLVLNTYNWSVKQYSCLNSLWTKRATGITKLAILEAVHTVLRRLFLRPRWNQSVLIGAQIH